MKIPKGLRVGRARNGMGIFATRSFPIRSRLFEVTGKKVQCLVDDDMDETERDNTFRYSLNWYISPTNNVGKFLNHSCVPNARLQKIGTSLYITSLRNIAPGEEILIDYSTMIASDDAWEMRCNCGEKNCRKTIGTVRSLSKTLRAQYKKLHAIPPYIK